MDEIDFTDLGSKLKQVREAKGISLEDVQGATKIPIDILRSIERDEKLRKISPVYLKGFLKIYAKFLGVKITTEGAEQKSPLAKPTQTFSNVSKKNEFNFSFLEKIDFLLWFKILVTLLVLIGLINLGIRLSRKRKSVVKEKKVSQEISTVAPAVAAAPKVSSAKPAAAKSAKIKNIKLSLRAKENTWLQVKRDGKTVFRSVLRKGTSESWVAQDKFELSIGNAAALELELNSKIISPLGRHGQALKSVVITKEGLTVNK